MISFFAFHVTIGLRFLNGCIKQTTLSTYRFLHPNCDLPLNFAQSKKCSHRMAMLAFFLNLKVQI